MIPHKDDVAFPAKYNFNPVDILNMTLEQLIDKYKPTHRSQAASCGKCYAAGHACSGLQAGVLKCLRCAKQASTSGNCECKPVTAQEKAAGLALKRTARAARETRKLALPDQIRPKDASDFEKTYPLLSKRSASGRWLLNKPGGKPVQEKGLNYNKDAVEKLSLDYRYCFCGSQPTICLLSSDRCLARGTSEDLYVKNHCCLVSVFCFAPRVQLTNCCAMKRLRWCRADFSNFLSIFADMRGLMRTCWMIAVVCAARFCVAQSESCTGNYICNPAVPSHCTCSGLAVCLFCPLLAHLGDAEFMADSCDANAGSCVLGFCSGKCVASSKCLAFM
jgi:hypothetical protein